MATNDFRQAAEAELNKRTEIAKQFVQFYYSLFDNADRSQVAQLQNLYNDQSMLTFEDGKFFGKQDIMQKLLSLPFQKVAHSINDFTVQCLFSGILVSVGGELKVDEEANALQFSQIFVLVPENESYVISNDLFRFRYS